ncbi:MAG: class I SAM-dependent methyltransferase [Spirochaetales bacterium]
MSHYFEDIEHKSDDFFSFEDYINNKVYKFNSCNNVFAKNEVDYGTQVLIKAVINNFDELGERVLDLGCGYGAIGISLADHYKNSKFLMSDITNTAVTLAKQNLKLNGITNAEVVVSNLFQNIDGEFNFIATNPPIKIGKSVLLNLISESQNRLQNDGHLVLVIKKSHGKDSIKKVMEQTFGNCTVLKRDAGYYILDSQKIKG